MYTVCLIKSDSVMVVESSRAVAIQPHNWGYRVVNGIDAQLSEYDEWLTKWFASFEDHDEKLQAYFKFALHSEGREYEMKLVDGRPSFEYLKP